MVMDGKRYYYHCHSCYHLIQGHPNSLHLADNLVGFPQAFDHLLAFFSAADGVVAFFEEVVVFGCSVHVFQEFALHFFFCESGELG